MPRPRKGITPLRNRRTIPVHITDAELAELGRYSVEYQTSKIDLVTSIIREWIKAEQAHERFDKPDKPVYHLHMGYTVKRQYLESTLNELERQALRTRALAEHVYVRDLVSKIIREYLATPIDKPDKQLHNSQHDQGSNQP